MTEPSPQAALAAPTEVATRDVTTTLRNAMKLGGSLILTLWIGFGVRIALRRYLGPAVIGPINFAEAFTATGFVFVGLGLDMYIRKVVPVRHESATEFLGTFLALRLGMTVLLFAGMAAFLELRQESPQMRLLVYVFGVAQLLVSLNATFTAILHSTRTVDGLSVLNVVGKLLWAGGFVATMVFDLPLVGIPLSVALSELVKAVASLHLIRKHAAFRLTLDFRQLKPVFLASLAFYLNTVAHTVYNRIDISMLHVGSNEEEIGLYSAAAELAQMTFILAPMFGGVLMPLFARAAARSAEEYDQLLRRTLEVMLSLAIPASLAMSLGADVWIRIQGHQYDAATLSLRILGPNFILTYVAVILAIALNLNGGEWGVTFISLGGMVLNPVVVWLLMGPFSGLGVGGAGAGCAAAQVATELLVTLAMFWRIGRRAVDRRLVLMLVKTAAVCGVIVALDALLLSSLGPARLLIEAPLYVVLAVATGALRVKETLAFARQSMRRGSPA